MEVGHHLAGGKHGDRVRAQMEVEGAEQPLGQPVAGEIAMGYLPERVDAGIGATGRRHGRSLAGKGSEGALQRTLYGRSAPLALPALEGTAVIF